MISYRGFAVFGIAAVILGLLCGCASTQGVSSSDGEEWVGEIFGMAQGDLKLFVSRMEVDGECSVRGSLSVNLDKTAGGYGSGRLAGRIKGTVTNKELKANVSGHVFVTEGSSRINGKMMGTMSETAASGNWTFGHSEGVHSGEWNAHKVK